ncbi:hypothetical protein C8F04DRAFT_1272653 [Mycena alexandri]|uniref:Uncharacterized protein n=1 Tax=Mycena alexandri TaxID=1745969 RepID=A0AAD6S8M9_9AGAR|nr:hypothetical protein C8F04DRAFT_1272653 [Mycena alexandri]
MAGISSQLAKFGVAKKKDLKSTDIDTSRYLWPSYLFPILNDESWSGIDAMEETGMEWIGVEFDARDLILNLKSCYLEVELLLHTTPQIYTTKQWLGVARTPDSKRGFKVVIALEFKTHVLAFLSRDNNARVYWLSIPDMKATNRVPDIVLDFWGWSEFTVKWLEERGAKDDKKSAGSVLSEAGNHPGRGIGRYMRNETLNLAGLPPETLWGKIRKDPRKLAQVVTALRYVRMSQTLNTQKFLSRSMKYNNTQMDGSHLLIRTTEDTVRFARELRVHGKLESRTSSRRKALIDTYNAMSDKTHAEAEAGAADFFGESSTKTNMAQAPLFFDPGEVTLAILLFDGLGPLLFEDWEEVSQNEGMLALKEIRYFYDHLPDTLTRLERLSLKPLPLLTDLEHAELVAIRGGSVNPLVRYLQGPGFHSAGINNRTSSTAWSLIKDPVRCPMPTYLYKDKEKKSIWCLTRAPFSTTTKNPEHSPPDAVLFTRASDEERRRSTVEYIQQYENKESVGPLAFCGHAVKIKVNRYSSFVAPCLYHPDLTERQQELVLRARDAHRNPNVGMRKGTSSQVKAEQKFRLRVRKDLREELGREPTRSEISIRTREKKKASKAKGKERALAIEPPSFKIQSKRLKERYGGKAGALLLKSQASRLLGVKGAEIGDINVDSDVDMGAEENSVGDMDIDKNSVGDMDIDENESVEDMESMVDSEEDGSCMVDDE